LKAVQAVSHIDRVQVECVLAPAWTQKPRTNDNGAAYPPPHASAPRQDGPRTNEDIRVPKVLLIDEHGEKQGIMPTSAAIEAAQEAGLDLVEVSPNADPPVCKILDYGKFRFQEQKKKNERASAERSSRSKRSSCGPTSTTTITT
jgi:hypothetical protein